MIDWFGADWLNHTVALLLTLFALYLAIEALVAGRVRRGELCRAPLRRGSDHLYCRNPKPEPGQRCAAGHRRPWPLLQLLLALGVLVVAALVGTLHPLPRL